MKKMQQLAELNEILRSDGIVAALDVINNYEVEHLDFTQENSNSSMNILIHDTIKICNDENFREVFYFLNKIGSVFGLNVSLSLEILSFNLRRNIDLTFQVNFYENLPQCIKEFSDIQMLGAESYRRSGSIDKSLSIYLSLPNNEGWWPYDDIWQLLSYNLSFYLLKTNFLFFEHQKPYKWSFNSSASKQSAISDLISGMLNPWRHDPITFKKDILNLLENCQIPKIDTKHQILEYLASHITDLDTDRASVVFQLLVSENKFHLIERLLKNKSFVYEVLAIEPNFIFSFDICKQKCPQFANTFFEILDAFLQSSQVRRFVEGDWMAFEGSSFPNTRSVAFEILSRYSSKQKNLSMKYIPFIEKNPQVLTEEKHNSIKHLFVGFYGTPINLELSLEKFSDYFKKDAHDWKSNGNLLSIGISVLKEEKFLNKRAENKIDKLDNFIPEKLKRILRKFDYSNLDELQTFLPHTVEVIKKDIQAQNKSQEDYIENIYQKYEFFDGFYLNVISKDFYLDEYNEVFLQLFNDHKEKISNIINLCYCLDNFYKLLSEAEISSNVNIDRIVLVNINAEITNGSLINLCNEAQKIENKIFSSEINTNNISLEGNNSYFAGSKNSISKLLYSYKFVMNIINSYVFSYLYSDQICNHKIFETVLYENDCDIAYSSEIKLSDMTIDISWEDLSEALLKDSFCLEDDNLLRFIRNEMKN